MNAVRWVSASALLVVTACATSVGEWDGELKGQNAAALRNEVRESLVASNWAIIQDTDQMVAGKPGTGGHRTLAKFSFAEAGDDSTFHLRGGSHHRFNWATFGILGLTMRNQAAFALSQWYEAWVGKHPKS